MDIRIARGLAERWGSQFADAGAIGQINAESGIGAWRFGQFLLEQLLKPNQHVCKATRGEAGISGEAFCLPQEREASPALQP